MPPSDPQLPRLPQTIPGRRTSFIDYGGVNSISNFALSYLRAVAHLGHALDAERDLSPCTSNDDPFPASPQGGDPRGLPHSAHGKHPRDLDSFHFPEHPSETTPLNRPPLGPAPLPAGCSTAPQTVFNAVNTLMGVAMLLLPYGMRLAGWVPLVAILALCAVTTAHTARVLGSVLAQHKTARTYADVAHLWGGPAAAAGAAAVFLLDLLGASLLMVLIFSDSFSTLLPAVPAAWFKAAVVSTTFVLSFFPLRMVLFVSAAGVLCTVGVLVVILACGVLPAAGAPSLLHPAATRLWPASGLDLCLSLGIFMAPWGGHPVFPELYRDMRHPYKYPRCCLVAFTSTFVLDLLVATIGYLMYGPAASDSLTKNIIASPAYPWVPPLLCTFLGLLPVCKLALITRPIVSVYEARLGLLPTLLPWLPARVLLRVAFMVFLFLLSVAFTLFGRVVAFLGSAICFTICVTLPLLFSLKLVPMSSLQRRLTYVGVAVGMACAVLGTYGAFFSD